MKLLSIIIFTLLFVGCSGEQMAHDITKAQISMSGNKPPAKYRVANLQTMKDYVFETKYFSFKFATAKETDFTKMGGWWGASHRDGKTITSHLSPMYHITVSTSGNVLKYEERERAVENKDIQYIKNRMRLDKGDTLTIRNYGIENYPCVEIETEDKYNRKKTIYSCYKFDIGRTQVKTVSISVTHTNYKSSKGYTYQDLKRRAQRTLDSLYIKDGW